MGDKASLLRFDHQPPIIRLLVSFLFTVVTGTIFFWIFIWCGSLIFDTDISGMLTLPDEGAGREAINILRYAEVSQQISLFLIPALLLSMLLRRGNEHFLKLDSLPHLTDLLLITLIIIVIVPVISWTGIINSKLDLPGWLSGLETALREKEDKAAGITGLLIGANGISGLTINILILAVLPAIAEELIFRGIFQQLFISLFRSSHTGIWVTSIIFSAIHMQFYGFLPRLILGLLFGYMFFWSGNLWAAIVPHFINNSMPVLMVFLSGNRTIIEHQQTGGNVFPFINLVISALLIFYLWQSCCRRKAEINRVSGDN